MSIQNYQQLKDLLGFAGNTQLMKQTIDLYALKYIKVKDLFLVHSYFEKNGDKSHNPLFAAPALVHSIERNGDKVDLTLKTLRDIHDLPAVALARGIDANLIELAYSHLKPELLQPKIQKGKWDNWVFSYTVSDEEKLKRRIARTKRVATKLFNSIPGSDFENKNILFLGCGDGDEIETFIQHFDIKKAEIWGVDDSPEGVKNAGILLEKYSGINFQLKQMDIVNVESLKDITFDFIFAFGVIDRETLNFQDGVSLMKGLKKHINFKSLYTTAYTFELFDRGNYTDLGFQVLEGGLSSSIYTQNYSFFYHIQKSDEEGQDTPDLLAHESLSFFS